MLCVCLYVCVCVVVWLCGCECELSLYKLYMCACVRVYLCVRAIWTLLDVHVFYMRIEINRYNNIDFSYNY